jgi:hypothetical protein
MLPPVASTGDTDQRWSRLPYAVTLLLEAAGALVLVVFGFLVITGTPNETVFGGFTQSTTFDRATVISDVSSFAAYVLPLLVTAAITAWSAVRRLRGNSLSLLDAAVVVAQPFVLALGALAIETVIDDWRIRQGQEGSAFLVWLPVVGIVVGAILVIAECRRARDALLAVRRSVACLVTCAVAVLPCLALSASGVSFGTHSSYSALEPLVDNSGSPGLPSSFVHVRLTPTRALALSSVSCAGSSCAVLGVSRYELSWGADVVYSRNGGRWAMQRLPQTLAVKPRPFSDFLSYPSLLCADARRCLVVGGLASADRSAGTLGLPVARTGDGGASWQVTPAIAPLGAPTHSELFFFLHAASCDRAGECVVGTPRGLFETTDFGSHWRPVVEEPSTSSLAGVWCTGSSRCLALTGPSGITAGPGKHPAAASLYVSGPHLHSWKHVSLALPRAGRQSWPGSGFTCVSLSRCLVTTSAGLWIISDGGGRWSASAPTPSPGHDVRLLGCFGSACYAHTSTMSDPRGRLWRSADGGRSWSPTSALPRGVVHLFTLNCSSPLDCLGIGLSASASTALVATSDGGRTWSIERLPALPERWLPAPVEIPPS